MHDFLELENACCNTMCDNIITAEVRFVKHIKAKDGREFDQCFMSYQNNEFENNEGMVEVWVKPQFDKNTNQFFHTHVGNVWYLIRDGYKFKPLSMKHQ